MRQKQLAAVIILLSLILCLSIFTGTASAQGGLQVSRNLLIFSRIQNTGATTSQTSVLTNTSGAPITINSVSLLGNDAGMFSLSAFGTPLTLNPGASRNINVTFNPTSDGVKIVNVRINGVNYIELRGLGTRGTGGINEPSLQRILDAFAIPVNVGDDQNHSTIINSLQQTAGGAPFAMEIASPTFIKAGSGDVTIEVLAAYGNQASPVAKVGWYPVGSSGTLNQVFTVNSGSSQTLYPATTPSAGAISFNPGSTTFGLYSMWTYFSNRVVYSQDSLNTWVTNPNERHKVRVYPLRSSNGSIVPNAYIITNDEYVGGFNYSFDFNDVVYIIRNVQAQTPAVGQIGGQIRVENPLWQNLLAQQGVSQMNYLNRWMTIGHIKGAFPNRGGTSLYYHNRGTARIYNESSTQTLQITGLNLSDPAHFFIANGDTVPINVFPNSYRDIQVYFRGDAALNEPAVYNGTLNIVTTASNEPNILIQLRGAFMPYDEGPGELHASQIIQSFGFGTNFAFPFSSTYSARGDEVLSHTWQRADSNLPIYVRQIAAYHGCCDFTKSVFRIGSIQMRHDALYGQSLMPILLNGSGPAEMTVASTSSTFPIFIEDVSSAICQNVNPVSNCTNHGIRFWPMRTPNGILVPNTYIVLQDYIPTGGCTPSSGNGLCDYNDNMYIVTNLQPTYQRTDLSVSLTLIPNPTTPGTPVTFTALATNVTVNPANNSRLTVTLNDAFTINSVTPDQAGVCTQTGLQIVCNYGTLSGSAQRTLTINATPNSQGTFTNSAVVATSSSEYSTQNNSKNVTSEVSGEGQPTLALHEPLGTITNSYGDPLFRWEKKDGATYYYLYLTDSNGEQVVNEVLSGTERCTGDFCSVTLTTLNESYRLFNGTYNWTIIAWANGGILAQSIPRVFTLSAAPPTLVTLDPTTDLNTLRPTFNWTVSTTSQKNATAFNVVVVADSDPLTPVLNSWVTRIDACGSATGMDCDFSATIDLGENIDYSLGIQSYGPGGLSTGGTLNNGFAGPQTFVLDVLLPDLPTNIQVNYNQGLPTISWADDSNADSFNVVIGTQGWASYPFFQNYPRTTGANGLCSSGVCRVNPLIVLTNGVYNFGVNAVNELGPSVGGTYDNGYGVLENQTLNKPLPTAPSAGFIPALNSTINIGRPTFTWNTVVNAISYQVWVGTVTPAFTTSHMMWYWAATPTCTPHPGTCSITPELTLGNGNYAWNVQAYGPGGLGNWANTVTGISFSINNTLPGLVTLNTPSGTITDDTPTFVWDDISNVEWYNVWVGTTNLVPLHNTWYRAERGSGKLCNNGICSLTIAGLVLPNNLYWWNIQAATPAGFGPWQTIDYGIFTVSVAPPPAPSAPNLLSPSNNGVVFSTNRPTLSWNTAQYATAYEVEVKNASDVVVYGTGINHPANALCSGSTCSIQVPDPIAYGTYTWTVRGIGLGGTGAWATVRSFLSLSVNVVPMMAEVQDGVVALAGSWNEVAGDALAVGQDYMVSSGAGGDSLALAFNGTGLDVVYVAGPQYGMFVIEIDGVPMLGVNAYAPEMTFGQVASIANLSAGQHVIRIVPQGALPVGIDAIVVGGQVLIGAIIPTVTPIPPTPAPIQPLPVVTEVPATVVPPTPAPVEVTPEVVVPTPAPVEPLPEATGEAPTNP